jgi:hypothetical protein
MSKEIEPKDDDAASEVTPAATDFEKTREAIRIGIDQADRGEVAPLDVQGTLAKLRSRKKTIIGN